MFKKIKLIIQLITISMIFQSCSFDDDTINYEEQLVVFASINAGFPVFDTVFVSRSAEINESVDSEDLYIENADVRLMNISDGSQLKFYSLGKGRYYPIDATIHSHSDSVTNYWLNYIISSGTIYRLVVAHEDNSVIAETNVPEKIEILSAEISEFQCPDGSSEPVNIIDVNNLENFTFSQMLSLYLNPSEYIEANNINVDSVEFKIGDCFTKSFASAPMFSVDYNQDDYNTIQIISNALESDVDGLEPFNDENQNGVFDEGENFSDRNRNGLRDSCYINLIYSEQKGLFDNDSLDYNTLANIWKEPLKRGADDGTWRANSPYRNNPWLWNVDISPTPIMWLYFDYYGYYMMTFKSTSDSYFNYFKGDPVGQNIYLLPDSNFEGGLGVFYSSSSTSFIVKVIAATQ